MSDSDTNPSRDQDQKSVSLGFEAATLAAALDGSRMLVDMVRRDNAPNDVEGEELPAAVSATLSLVVCRLQLIRRVVNGENDAELLFAPHNAHYSDPKDTSKPNDVLLKVNP